MLNNLVIATFILAVAQPTSAAPLKPITDPNAYAIYATLASLHLETRCLTIGPII